MHSTPLCACSCEPPDPTVCLSLSPHLTPRPLLLPLPLSSLSFFLIPDPHAAAADAADAADADAAADDTAVRTKPLGTHPSTTPQKMKAGAESRVVPLGADQRAEAARRRSDVVFRNGVIWKVSLSVLGVCVCLAAGTMFYALYEPETFNALDAFYFACVTLTTIGYGDFSPKTQGGRLFAVFWIVISTFSLAKAVSVVFECYAENQHRLYQRGVLTKQVDTNELFFMDRGGDGMVSEAEFIVYKLQAMGLVKSTHIAPILAQFKAMDVDGSGQLSKEDIRLARHRTRRREVARRVAAEVEAVGAAEAEAEKRRSEVGRNWGDGAENDGAERAAPVSVEAKAAATAKAKAEKNARVAVLARASAEREAKVEAEAWANETAAAVAAVAARAAGVAGAAAVVARTEATNRYNEINRNNGRHANNGLKEELGGNGPGSTVEFDVMFAAGVPMGLGILSKGVCKVNGELGIRVSTIVAGQQAARSIVALHDWVVAVNGADVSRATKDRVIGAIKAGAGAPVVVRFRRERGGARGGGEEHEEGWRG